MEITKGTPGCKHINKDIYMLYNVPVYWAKLRVDNMDTRFDENGLFTLDVVLPEDIAKNLNKEFGLAFKEKQDQDGNKIDDGLWKFRLKKKRVITVDGKEKTLDPPDVVDKSLKPITCNVGNESICNVSFRKRAFKYKMKTGTTYDLRGVQVINLVPYEDGAKGDFEVLDSDFKESEVEQEVNIADEDLPF